MKRIRVIPVLLFKSGGLVKTVQFSREKYVGDPINAVRIFNEKEVDELVLLDITASEKGRPPDPRFVEDLAGECFMPFCYGGGVSDLEQIQKLLRVGAEKVSLNTAAVRTPELVEKASRRFGSQSVVVSIDVKKHLLGRYSVHIQRGKQDTGIDPVEFAKEMARRGAGELLLNSIDRDGTYQGYDIDLIRKVSHAVTIPVVACGGARNVDDFVMAVRAGASAVAAGSMFVFHGVHRAVLINFPSQELLKEELYSLF